MCRWARHPPMPARAEDPSYAKFGQVVHQGRERLTLVSCFALVGATLVVARVGVVCGVGLANTGDHKGRPYDRLLRRSPSSMLAATLRCRTASNSKMLAATETFRLETLPARGIRAR